MTHYAHYVRRSVVEIDYADPAAPWFARHPVEDEGFDAPRWHAVGRARGLAAAVQPGDTVWVFSQLAGAAGALPPALDACVVVRRVRTDAQGRRFLDAAPGSRWFPLFDATRLLHGSRFLAGAEGAATCLGGAHAHVGQALRLMRRVVDPRALERHALRVERAERVFVSYRLLDGTRAAHAVADRELRQGRAVVWDRWSLPRRMAERREFASPRALDRCIRAQIERADRVIGICSPRYGEVRSYSRREQRLAMRLGTYEGHVVAAPAGASR